MKNLSTPIAVGILALGAGISGWIVARDTVGDSIAVDSQRGESPTIRTQAVPVREDAAPAAEVLPATPSPADAPSATEEPWRAPIWKYGEHQITGTVLMVDSQGIESATEDGSFVIRSDRDENGSWTGVEVSVVRGAFHASIPSHTCNRLDSLKLGEQICAFDGILPEYRIDEDLRLDLRAHVTGHGVLRVRDAVTGADLSDVEIRVCLCSNGSAQYFAEHPGEDSETLVSGARSPVTIKIPEENLLLNDGDCACFARAPGYAWQRVGVRTDRTFARQVLLVRSGCLRVVVRSSRTRVPYSLHLGRPNDRFAESVCGLVDGEVVESLAPGRYVVTAFGKKESHVTGNAEVDVTAGAMAQVELSLEVPEDRRVAPVSGTVQLTRGWDPSLCGVALRRVGADPEDRDSFAGSELAPVAGQSDLFRWDAGKVAPGRWLATFAQHGFEIDVPRDGRNDIHLIAPPAAEVVVRLVDRATGGQPRSFLGLCWRRADVAGSVSRESRTVWPDESTGGYRFITPQGPIIFEFGFAAGSEYQEFHERVEVGSARNEFTIAVTRLCSLRIVAKDGDMDVPDGFEVSIADANGRPIVTKERWHLLSVPCPGRYRVTLDSVHGYLPPPPQDVDVVAGEFATVVFQLTPVP